MLGKVRGSGAWPHLGVRVEALHGGLVLERVALQRRVRARLAVLHGVHGGLDLVGVDHAAEIGHRHDVGGRLPALLGGGRGRGSTVDAVQLLERTLVGEPLSARGSLRTSTQGRSVIENKYSN